MLDKKFWKLEYSIVLFVLLGIMMLFVPVSFENTRQANLISKWNERYNRVDYMFQVINAHITDDMIKSFNSENTTTEQKKQLLIQLVKPYLRIDMEINVPKRYHPKYMNGSRVYKGQWYYFDKFYFSQNNGIVGIQELPKRSLTKPIFMMMFDINGLIPPNRWGKDIFGINIYQNGKIEPLGEGIPMDELVKYCSESGTGISCSYYYKIGGAFED